MTRLPRGPRAAAALVLALASAACADATGPGSLVGLHALATVDGGGLPSAVYDQSFEDGTRLLRVRLGDTLEFLSDTSVVRRGSERNIFYASPTAIWWDVTAYSTVSGSVRRQGDVLHVTWRLDESGGQTLSDTLRLAPEGMVAEEAVPATICEGCPATRTAVFVYRRT